MTITIDCFKAYDVRGQIPNQLNADICYRIGNATASYLNAKTIVLGRDIRLSSEELAAAVAALLLAAGQPHQKRRRAEQSVHDRVREHVGVGVARQAGLTRILDTVAIDVEHGYAVSGALKARDVICDYRPGAGIRLSPHFYTMDEELDGAIEAVTDILASGEWRRFEGREATVT